MSLVDLDIDGDEAEEVCAGLLLEFDAALFHEIDEAGEVNLVELGELEDALGISEDDQELMDLPPA